MHHIKKMLFTVAPFVTAMDTASIVSKWQSFRTEHPADQSSINEALVEAVKNEQTNVVEAICDKRTFLAQKNFLCELLSETMPDDLITFIADLVYSVDMQPALLRAVT